ncbi:hypothetical protein ACHAXT_011354 [Thalassiosira profunda]
MEGGDSHNGGASMGNGRGRHRARRGRLLALLLALTFVAVVVASVAGGAAGRLRRSGATTIQSGPLDTRTFLATMDACAGGDASCLAEALAKLPVHATAQQEGDICNRLLVGTHHKSGTVLAKRLFRVLCPNLPEGRRLNHVKPRDYAPGMPFVHFIRDPLEIVVSAYQYHQTTTEVWAVESGYQAMLRNASVVEGLEMEWHRSSYDSIQEEWDVYRHTARQPENAQDVFTIREGDLAQREGFRFIMMALQHWLEIPIDPAPLEKCCFLSEEVRQRGNRHASKSSEKEDLRRAVMARHARDVARLRREMDFPPKGLEPAGEEWGRGEHDGEALGSATTGEGDERRYWSCPPAKSHCVG